MFLIITSVALNVGRISSEFLLSFVMIFLSFVVMVILLLSMISLGVNYESFIFSFSHLLFSYYDSIFFLCPIFLDSTEIDQISSGTISLNEWIPWSWETIQGGHNNLFFFYLLFNLFELFIDLSNPCEVKLYSLGVLYLHILQVVPQSQLPVDVLSFEHLCQSIILPTVCWMKTHGGWGDP